MKMLKWALLLGALAWSDGAAAQNYIRITNCGDARPPAGASSGYMSVDGLICMSDTGGVAATIADGADVTQGAIADAAATEGGTGTISAKLRNATALLNDIKTNTSAPIPAGTATIGNVGLVYPAGSTPINASATGTTGATTATLPANASKATYICGFSIRANATAAATADSTVTGTVTTTLHFTQWTAPFASGIGITEIAFSPCIVSSATNTAIAVISAAPGSGGVVSVSAWGFQF